MDFAPNPERLLVVGGFGLLIVMVEIAGLILGIASLRHKGRGLREALIGTTLNGLGLLCIVALVVLAAFTA